MVLLKRRFWRLPVFGGVKVIELHPGETDHNGEEYSHGVHAHFVTNSFLPAKVVWALARHAGFGRVYVERTTGDKMGKYLTKYLVKQQSQRDPALKGARLWSAFGSFKKQAVKVKDVIYSSPFGDFFKAVVEVCGYAKSSAWSSASVRFIILRDLWFKYCKWSADEMFRYLVSCQAREVRFRILRSCRSFSV
jgi:hypothetical protein